jgi:TPR repeat protein/serine/threonine protein kinase
MSNSTKRMEDSTKRMDADAGTKRMGTDGTMRMDADTARMEDSTVKMEGDKGGGPMGIIVFATGQPLELNGKSYTVESIISMSSGEAIVYKISIDGKHYVFKHYKFNTPLTDTAKEVLGRIKDNPKDRVIHLYDFGRFNDQDFEIMELAQGGTLNQYLKSLGAVKDPQKLRKIVKMITEGLVSLHADCRVIHQDIKPENIYFRDAQGTALVIADFGISNPIDNNEEVEVVANKTPLYAAPELTPAEGTRYVIVTPSIDYYALGITMLELWLGEKPFRGIPSAKREDIIRKEQVEFPDDMPEDCKIIIRGLIKPQLKDRWGKQQLQKWLNGEALTLEETKKSDKVYGPIQIGTETANSPEELAALIERNPAKGSECLYSGAIASWLEKAGDAFLSAEIKKITTANSDRETGRFLAMYTLDPGHPFITKGGKVCKNIEEIADALLEESVYYMEELRNPTSPLYLYLSVAEGEQGKIQARDFCGYFEEHSPKYALNLIYLKLQYEGGITIGKKKYYKGEEIAKEKDLSQIAAVKKSLLETDSHLLVWLSDKYADYLQETDEFTELPPWSQFFLLGLFPFLSYKEMIPDWKEKAMFDLQFMLSAMPGRSDLFEAYAAQGLPLTGHLPNDERGSTPIDFLLYNYSGLKKEHGVKTINDLIRLLLKLEADPNELSGDGTGPCTNVFRHGDQISIKILKEYMPDLSEKDMLGNAVDDVEKILILQQAHRYKEALRLLRPHAEQGNASGQFILGYYYDNGWGVTKDYIEAVKWYRKAAEQNHAAAMDSLGDCYFNGTGVEKDKAKGVEWYRKAAELGLAGAQWSLGLSYQKGDGVPKDEAKAVEWFLKAAEQKDEDAMIELGDCYSFGKGVKQDYTKAFEWYLKAAERGNADAQAVLGDCYMEGNGVKQDKAKAIEWYRKAAEQGHEGSQDILKELGK